ncbi:MAG TPA: hypothetical protein VD907_06245 [Verrucomicrobiae bacterium]|nr:hypothetical protein [Verrucomicrobiae bacterium]
MGLKVISVESQGRFARVSFSDNHRITFYENTGGWGMPTCLERVLLKDGEEMVVEFVSPYQYPINHRPFGFRVLKDGYRERLIAYWTLALSHAIKGKASDETLADTWRTIILGGQELEDIKSGK